MTGNEIIAPKHILAIVKNGLINGSAGDNISTANDGAICYCLPWTVMRFQSKVGHGLRPRPLNVPVINASLTLLGAIHVVQLKYDIAWQM